MTDEPYLKCHDNRLQILQVARKPREKILSLESGRLAVDGEGKGSKDEVEKMSKKMKRGDEEPPKVSYEEY